MSGGGDDLLAGADEAQVRMMEERVILVDEHDNVLGSASKKESHLTENIDKGMLHRAFSVFMIDPEGKLLLQQRAASKITFPSFWANTCCSHPLYRPGELEEENALGVKRAAQRKLEQELGISPEEVPLESFTFVGKVHYGAEGDDGVWGEHEVDHVLICRPERRPRVEPNENEVQSIRWVSREELNTFLRGGAEKEGALVARWFAIISLEMLPTWWDALEDGSLRAADPHACPIVRGAGIPDASPSAGARLASAPAAAPGAEKRASAADTAAAEEDAELAKRTDAASRAAAERVAPAAASVRKQGAYGKVPVHSESLFSQFLHVDEIWSFLVFKLGASPAAHSTTLPADAPRDQVFCETMLDRTSRSFAMVIKQLPDRLRRSICVFYLVLRGLDTVEDDMEAYRGRDQAKVDQLRSFYQRLEDTKFKICGVGEGDEAALLEGFGGVCSMFASLPGEDRRVIRDVCRDMGRGMAQFVHRDLREGTEKVADYNLYCHYVAGLVGEGLSRLFAASGREGSSIAAQLDLANDMGLLLQKTNIIRDYLEDYVDGRTFWPKQIWGRHAEALGDLQRADEGAVECLNEMIADALTHAPACLRYMQQLRDPHVFRFCAIPQLMAMATLAKLTNNPDVFTGVVKIRKGQAVSLMLQAGTGMPGLCAAFLRTSRAIAASIPARHIHARAIAHRAAMETEQLCLPWVPPSPSAVVASELLSGRVLLAVAAVFVSLVAYLFQRRSEWGEGYYSIPRLTDSWDVAALAAAVACGVYLCSFSIIPILEWVGSNTEEGEKASKGEKLIDPAEKSPTGATLAAVNARLAGRG